MHAVLKVSKASPSRPSRGSCRMATSSKRTVDLTPDPWCEPRQWPFLTLLSGMEFSLMPHFSRCVRAQQKITMTGSGSEPPFAALKPNGCFRLGARFLREPCEFVLKPGHASMWHAQIRRWVGVPNGTPCSMTCSTNARVAQGGVGKSSKLSRLSERCDITACDLFCIDFYLRSVNIETLWERLWFRGATLFASIGSG